MLLIPKSAIAARWHGACEARQRQEPLEVFLRSRKLPYETSGPSRSSRNLATAGAYFARQGIDEHCAMDPSPLDHAQHAALALMTCAVCDALALVVEAPMAWRIAALLCSVQTLTPHLSQERAAHFAAAAVHAYATEGVAQSTAGDFKAAAAAAIRSNLNRDVDVVVALVAQSLAAHRAQRSGKRCPNLRTLVRR